MNAILISCFGQYFTELCSVFYILYDIHKSRSIKPLSFYFKFDIKNTVIAFRYLNKDIYQIEKIKIFALNK